MPSVADLATCATAHLDVYVDPAGGRAFATYDRLGDEPNTMAPVDVFAPGLLDAPVRGDDVRRLFLPEGPHRDLRVKMEKLLLDEDDYDRLIWPHRDGLNWLHWRLAGVVVTV